MKLRKNQVEPVRKGVEFFKKEVASPSIIVAPTAFGKSIVISYIAKELNEKILVIQPSKELLEQNYNKFINLGGTASIYSASMGQKEIGDVTYATIGSIVKSPLKFKEFGIKKVIIDECDRFPREPDGMLRTFLSNAEITHCLGLTATPLKLQSFLDRYKQPYSMLVMLTSSSRKGNFFKNIIHVSQISEMIKLKFWSPLIYQTYDFDSKKLRYNTSGAEYSDASIKREYKNQNISQKIVSKVKDLTDRKSILIAVPSIAEAKNLEKLIPSCKALYSGIKSKERNKIIDDFKSGRLRCIAQVNILAIGFDHPELDCIITGRPTSSLSWWYQFVGRATRIHPNKKNALVVDFVGSVKTFGEVEKFKYGFDGKNWYLESGKGHLLTDIPIKEIGKHYPKNSKITPKVNESSKFVSPSKSIIPFGKFKGMSVSDSPAWWRKWMLENFKWNPETLYIKEAILNLESER